MKIFSSILGISMSITMLIFNPPLYDRYADGYDILNSGKVSESLGIDLLRKLAGEKVFGNVLEVAVGTGLQTEYYDWNKISKYTGEFILSLSISLSISSQLTESNWIQV